MHVALRAQPVKANAPPSVGHVTAGVVAAYGAEFAKATWVV